MGWSLVPSFCWSALSAASHFPLHNKGKRLTQLLQVPGYYSPVTLDLFEVNQPLAYLDAAKLELFSYMDTANNRL